MPRRAEPTGPAGNRRPGTAKRAASLAGAITAKRAASLAGAITAGLAVAIAASPAALGQQSRGQQSQPAGRLSVVIESVSPRWATPGRTVTVTGIVRNGTAQPQRGLSVQLLSSAIPLSNRDDLTLYAAGHLAADFPQGTPVPLPRVIPPGRDMHWTARLQPSAAGMTAFGVYPLAAQVLNSVAMPAATDRTFLPFWPGTAGQRPRPLSIAWLWPLIDRPYQLACPALLSNGLAGSLAPGGRLGRLLATGRSYSAAAHLTWVIDPALVQNARTMSGRHAVGGDPDCAAAEPGPASPAARAWLGRLSSATSGQQVFLTPYADVDVAALSHQGLESDLRSAFAESRAAGRQILHLPASSGQIAWPDNGYADSGVLGDLAINGIKTVVLDSTMMPPSGQPLSGQPPSYTPSAQETLHTGAGLPLNVLLADHTITQILNGGSAGAGPGTAFSTGQRFLAETAMIVAEAPSLSRSLVVAPPRRWNPDPGLAGTLLGDTVRAPWLKPTSLADLARASKPTGQVRREAPPNHLVSKGELGPGYLEQVGDLDAAIGVQASMLSPPIPGYLRPAVSALESTALRGGFPQAGIRQALLSRVLRYVEARDRKVAIIDRGQITLGGSSGKVPISISNRLPQTVQVRLHVRVPAGKRLTVGPFASLVSIASGKTVTIRVPVHASTGGVTDVTLGLLAPDGRLLPGTLVRLTVHATRFGTLALVIMCGALAVFVLTFAARAIRRARSDRAGGDGGPGGGGHGDPASDPPGPAAVTGSVMSGDDLAHDHPPEDPDEYADARGRASR
jgi:hypothetical protein